MHVPVLFGTRRGIDYKANPLAGLSDTGRVIYARRGGGRGCFTLDAKPLSNGAVLHVELEMHVDGNPHQGGSGGLCRIGVVPATDLAIDDCGNHSTSTFWGLQGKWMVVQICGIPSVYDGSGHNKGGAVEVHRCATSGLSEAEGRGRREESGGLHLRGTAQEYTQLRPGRVEPAPSGPTEPAPSRPTQPEPTAMVARRTRSQGLQVVLLVSRLNWP